MLGLGLSVTLLVILKDDFAAHQYWSNCVKTTGSVTSSVVLPNSKPGHSFGTIEFADHRGSAVKFFEDVPYLPFRPQLAPVSVEVTFLKSYPKSSAKLALHEDRAFAFWDTFIAVPVFVILAALVWACTKKKVY
jgi:hypothetical protein